MTADEIRQKLVEISDKLRTVADDDFSTKHRLNVEADQLRRQLDNHVTESDTEQLSEWAKRSGRKDGRSDDEISEGARAVISSPLEGGG